MLLLTTNLQTLTQGSTWFRHAYRLMKLDTLPESFVVNCKLFPVAPPPPPPKF